MADGLTLIFPHQLFDEHPSLDRSRPVVLLEDTLFFGDAMAAPGRFHRQKLVLHRASMKAYAKRLESRGFEVIYIDYERKFPVQRRLEEHWRDVPFESLHLVDPEDFLALKRVRRFAGETGVTIHLDDSPMFLTPLDWAGKHFDSRKRPFMASFYEAQRKRMEILIEADGSPVGGRWSYDDENRKPMPKRGLMVPDLPSTRLSEEVKEAIAYVESRFPDSPGRVDSFGYPVTHEDAERWLEDFLIHRFESFGPYEDSLATSEPTLFHSLLTPMLNIGLLTPQRVVDRVLEYAANTPIPLNSLEGFIRQVIGWREFIRLMYRRHGVEMRKGNFLNHQRPLPATFWDASTGIEPLDLVINRALDTGYAHHIERLMVLGNFMLLCQSKPDDVYGWFMELFVDAYDWVMVPNVYGMSQFSDGGIFTTKPYFSGSNYLKKMSDYAPGDWQKTWDGLFWSFVETHEDFLRGQHRLGMLLRNWERMDEAKRDDHRQNASHFLR